MKLVDEWLARKLRKRRGTLRTAKTVEEKHVRIIGPKGEYGWLRMTGAPSSDFAYRSNVEWPGGEVAEWYETAVLDGILDELLAAGPGMVVLDATFTLEAIKWHPVDSCPVAFYRAARAAIRGILSLHEIPGNAIDARWSE
jgi:hypothetical protein